MANKRALLTPDDVKSADDAVGFLRARLAIAERVLAGCRWQIQWDDGEEWTDPKLAMKPWWILADTGTTVRINPEDEE